MGVDVDASEMESEDDTHGGNRPKPGLYHVEIACWDDSFDSHDKVIADFRVLAGTVPGQEGKMHREYFALSDAAMPRLVCCCIAAGAVQPGERKAVEARDMLDRQLIIVLEERLGQDQKTYTNITWDGMYSLDNEAVATVPRADSAGPAESSDAAGNDDFNFDGL